MKKNIKLSKLIKILNLNIKVSNDFLIKNVSNIESAVKGDLTICNNYKYLKFLEKTKASACLVTKHIEKKVPSNCYPIVSLNPEIDFIKVSNLFYSDYVIDKISKKLFNKKQN